MPTEEPARHSASPLIPTLKGQFDPMALGRLLVSQADERHPRVLEQVRMYRGLPVQNRDQKGHSAARRQIAAWEAAGAKVFARPLRYPNGWPDRCLPGEKPQETGIDVSLAIDFVRLALEGRYEVGILLSADTDLKPPLKSSRRGPKVGRKQLRGPD